MRLFDGRLRREVGVRMSFADILRKCWRTGGRRWLNHWPRAPTWTSAAWSSRRRTFIAGRRWSAPLRYQLSQDPSVPEAMVFEPPGRIGTRRTMPEIDMTYGVQIPPDDPKALPAIIFGFLRGAARLTEKNWGVSIYGAVQTGGHVLVADTRIRSGRNSFPFLRCLSAGLRSVW